MENLHFLQALALTGGNWVIYLLIAFSVLALTVIIERGLIITSRTREQEAKLAEFGPALEKLDAPKAAKALPPGSILSRVAAEVQAHSTKALPIQEMALDNRLSMERKLLEKHLLVLGTLGNNAPFIGLLGTVLGVIKAFHDLGASAGQGPEVVMAGLAEALIATAVGIMVALPCVAAYNYLQKRINDMLLEADRFGRLLIADLAPNHPK
jgi:biopolymer transport protein ExbB